DHDRGRGHGRSGHDRQCLHAAGHPPPHPPPAGGGGRARGRRDLDRRPGQGGDRRPAGRTGAAAALHRRLRRAQRAYFPPQSLSSPGPVSKVASSAAGGAMLPSARAIAPRRPSAFMSGRNDGSLKVPPTRSGERSDSTLRSLGRGRRSRSRLSSRRLTVPSPTMMVSVLSNASAREVISPSSTPKSAKAQRMGTWRSSVSRNFSASAMS